MEIKFNMDIDYNAWANAIGYQIVGDKLVSKNVFRLDDFKQAISDYISEAIDSGTNSGAVEGIFFANDDEQHVLRDMLEEFERVEVIPSVVEEITDMSALTREEKFALIVDGADAVFLPGKIHGCEEQLYIIYHNSEANGQQGGFDIEKIDYERVLALYREVGDDAEAFFEKLPDLFQGEWCGCGSDSEDYANYIDEYANADFLWGRDGDSTDELAFIVNWAKACEAKNQEKNQQPEKDEGELERALEKQRRFVAWCGGYDKIKECCIEYNENNLKIIETYRNKHGRAYLGNINFHGAEAEKIRNAHVSPIYEYTGGVVQIFSCDFIVPVNDYFLKELLRINTVVHFCQKPVIEAIFKRIKELDGLTLLWT